MREGGGGHAWDEVMINERGMMVGHAWDEVMINERGMMVGHAWDEVMPWQGGGGVYMG